MITIYGQGYPPEERKNFTAIVSNNIISSMRMLCLQAPRFAPNMTVQPNNQETFERFRAGKIDVEVINEELGTAIQELWKDPVIQQTFRNRSQFQLMDSAEYFFNRLDEIKQRDYIPSHQDVLRSRVRTTGIVEKEFTVNGKIFRMFDVGGQRNERKKWIHCFENVSAVIFVAAISEYDQTLYEDEKTNRVVEAVNLFGDICALSWFAKSAFILFLNKRDIFDEKIKTVSLAHYFPDYPGPPGDAEEGKAYMRHMFVSKDTKGRNIYTHVTCATNTDNIRFVFESITKNVIDEQLRAYGLK